MEPSYFFRSPYSSLTNTLEKPASSLNEIKILIANQQLTYQHTIFLLDCLQSRDFFLSSLECLNSVHDMLSKSDRRRVTELIQTQYLPAPLLLSRKLNTIGDYMVEAMSKLLREVGEWCAQQLQSGETQLLEYTMVYFSCLTECVIQRELSIHQCVFKMLLIGLNAHGKIPPLESILRSLSFMHISTMEDTLISSLQTSLLFHQTYLQHSLSQFAHRGVSRNKKFFTGALNLISNLICINFPLWRGERVIILLTLARSVAQLCETSNQDIGELLHWLHSLIGTQYL